MRNTDEKFLLVVTVLAVLLTAYVFSPHANKNMRRFLDHHVYTESAKYTDASDRMAIINGDYRTHINEGPKWR